MTDFKDTAMGYPTSLAPTGAWPLDSRSYFESKNAADIAAAKATETSNVGTSMYYIGQPITVYDKTDGSVKLYYIGEDKTLHQIEDVEMANQVAYYLSDAISSKIFVRNYDENGNEISAYTDLSVIKIDKTSYELNVVSNTLLSNVLYVISASYNDAYGLQIKNLAAPTDSLDATTKKYVDDNVAAARQALSDYVDERITTARQDLSNYVDDSVDSARQDLSNYVDDSVDSARQDLSNYVNNKFNIVKTKLQSALTVSIEETSNLSTAINAILSIRNILSALYASL